MEKTQNVAIDKNWKALIKPSKISVKTHDNKSIATITAEPLEKGYGLTIGNSLRRIMLSSIRGSAVTAIQIDGVLHEFSSIKGVREDVTDIVLNVKSLALKSSSEELKKLILDEIEKSDKHREKKIGSENFRTVEKSFLLQIIDHSWKDHLLFLDYLKQGISLRAYGQKDPLNEYKREAFALFENMLLNIKRNISKVLSNIQFEQESEEMQEDIYKDQKLEKNSGEERGSFISNLDVKAKLAAQQFPEEVKKQEAKDKNCLLNFYPKNKIPRNTRCQSTSLKFKNCCGKVS